MSIERSDRGGLTVALEDVGKRYVKYEDAPTLIGRAVSLRSRTSRSQLWAVRHVSLAVGRGETLGVIGRNGSGKSTMLRMLAGVTAPTEGTVSVQGRVAPLISVGVGFHPELSGRENVYVNGTIIGMSRTDIERRFNSIVDFAEIHEFIDTPVKFYSSGMFVRLGFAVAVAADPDVLLVDEVLAVGDLRFQGKCFERMRQLQLAGTTIVLVSHNLNAVRNLCERVLVLHKGTPRFVGGVDEALAVYHEVLEGSGPEAEVAAAGVSISSAELLGPDGSPTTHIRAGDPVTVRVRARSLDDHERLVVGLSVIADSGVVVYSDSTARDGARPATVGEELECRIALDAHLPTGSFTARAVIKWGPEEQHATAAGPLLFYVSGRRMVGGVSDLRARFETAGRHDEDADVRPFPWPHG